MNEVLSYDKKCMCNNNEVVTVTTSNKISALETVSQKKGTRPKVQR